MRLFYLILILLPVNLAKHIPLVSSYVSGIKVDYLIPALYLTDILILCLLIFYKGSTLVKKLWPLLLLLPSVIFAASPIPALYKLIKLVEFGLFWFWLKANRPKISPNLVAKSLSFAIIFQSLLSLAQWFKQSSVFGYLFFGEQPFNQATANIDRIVWLDGSLKIPPLGTFPHPNVLAAFLILSLPYIYQHLSNKSLKIFTLILGLITLFLTFSLSTWLAGLLLVIPWLLSQHFSKIRAYVISLGLILIVLSLATRFSFLAPPSSFTRRSQLAQIAVKMIQTKPLAGIGLNNFTISMDQFGYVTSTTRFFQPVHNLFLLILAETGILGLIGLLLIATQIIKLNLSLAIILFLGLFDHYFLTLQQGLLLLTLFTAL